MGKPTFTQFGRPGQLVERPFGHAVYLAPLENPHGPATLFLGDLVRCAMPDGPGGEGWRIENDGVPHHHKALVELDGRVVERDGKAVERDLPTECRCGGGGGGKLYRSPEDAALALMNAAVAKR